MTTAYQHRPLSKILAPQADSGEQSKTSESKEADTAKQEAQELPDKFKGKSVEDIVAMYQNAEKRIGELGNELGTMRGIVTDLSKITRQPTESQTSAEDEKVDLSGDELIADPVSAIRKVVKHDFDKADLTRKESELAAQVESETARLLKDYGDLGEIVGSEEFQKFAGRTEYRRQDFQQAAYGEGMSQVRAARRLLEDYNDYNELLSKEDKADDKEDVKAAREASTEGGGNAGTISSKPKFVESDVLNVIRDEPEKWRSPQYQKEIMAAIKEGRYIKNA